ncbi:MarR family transcriptional regulator [Listeria goaensis]|uniref:MarR family transcriptional regulator n=1 Tax=Listeria goaensis TaxID=1649188 RepID=UPI000B590810|nr:MarR family transcriptional regulator [Listeria goaensis]
MQIQESKVEQMKELVSSYMRVQKAMKALTREHQNSMGMSYEQLRILKICAEQEKVLLREILYEVKGKHQIIAANIRGLTERGLLQVRDFQLTLTEKGKMILREDEMNTYIYKAFMKICTELKEEELENMWRYNQKVVELLNR